MADFPVSFAQRIWHSPMFMTWGGIAARLSGLLVLLPLVMTRFSVAETALWFLFSTLLSLQTLVDFGFSATFVRFVAYANSDSMVGLKEITRSNAASVSQNSNTAVVGNMRYIYSRLSILWLFLLVTFGSLAVARPIANIEAPVIGWVAWAIIAITSGMYFRGGMHVSYLRGMERVALHQRWEIITGLAITALGAAVLLCGGGLLELVVANQLGGFVRFIIYRNLAVAVAPENAWEVTDSSMFDTIWAAVWRSGLGVFATFGTIQVSGVLYAQIATLEEVASYLLALQLIRKVRQFAYVPFSTRIPDMSRMYASGDRGTLLGLSEKSMFLSLWVFLVATLTIGFGGEYLLEFIGSNTSFIPLQVWWLLSLAFLLELIGAMHIQLYSTTNHIVWHIANGLSGLIMLLMMPMAFHLYGIMGLPLSMVVGYAFFYVPYSMLICYRAFAIPFSAKNILSMSGAVLILLILLVSRLLWPY